MCVLRASLSSCVLMLMLCACKGSHVAAPTPAPQVAAEVGNVTITQRQLQQYMDYTLRFYSWVDSGAAQEGNVICSTSALNPECGTLRQQVLRRLVEERVIHNYAATHGIRLSKSDLKKVAHEMAALQKPRSPTVRLFTSQRISVSFMRSVLENQLLIRHVEAAVVNPSLLRGPSFRLRKFVFGMDKRSYRDAIDLATEGKQTLAPSATPPLWVAAFRLPAQVRRLAQYASPGDYVGPYAQGNAYVVLQILGSGVHTYARPAREQVKAREFRGWLQRQVVSTRPSCFQTGHKRVPCGTSND